MALQQQQTQKHSTYVLQINISLRQDRKKKVTNSMKPNISTRIIIKPQDNFQ